MTYGGYFNIAQLIWQWDWGGTGGSGSSNVILLSSCRKEVEGTQVFMPLFFIIHVYLTFFCIQSMLNKNNVNKLKPKQRHNFEMIDWALIATQHRQLSQSLGSRVLGLGVVWLWMGRPLMSPACSKGGTSDSWLKCLCEFLIPNSVMRWCLAA